MLLVITLFALVVHSSSQTPPQKLCFVPAEGSTLAPGATIPPTECPPELALIKDRFKAANYRGNLLLVDNTTSTMDEARKYAHIPDLLVVANAVYNSRYACNKSVALPRGDYYLTLNVKAHNSTKLPFVQSLAAVSTVEAMKELYGPSLDVSFSWPSYVNLARGVFTLGGALVEQNQEHSLYSIGFGIRANSTGMPNLRAAISGYNAINDQKMTQVEREQSIAKIVEKFRANLAIAEKDLDASRAAILKHIKGKNMIYFFNGTVTNIESDQKLFMQDENNMKLEVHPNCQKLMVLKNVEGAANRPLNDMLTKYYAYYFDGQIEDFGPAGELILMDSHNTKLHAMQSRSVMSVVTHRFTLKHVTCSK